MIGTYEIGLAAFESFTILIYNDYIIKGVKIMTKGNLNKSDNQSKNNIWDFKVNFRNICFGN